MSGWRERFWVEWGRGDGAWGLRMRWVVGEVLGWEDGWCGEAVS